MAKFFPVSWFDRLMIRLLGGRRPDLVIGEGQTLRWHLFRWRGVQVALHLWLKSDHDRALHDHSADNISILLSGCYRECFSHAWEAEHSSLRIPFWPYYRKGEQPHRVILHAKQKVWTIWIRFSPRRHWGFWCPKGWKPWEQYVAERGDYNKIGHSTVGPGCG